ncbi:ATP-binding protein [Streptomyces yaanensis]|uniref:DNA topoisomerase (ATP-hydrolyzing) n=1 Tax=Streptomyces yaanensis TaxID=1142239 RepID=A0ABV7S8K8_9ACTN|nr:ATP-binding protein [Streptomyces sp. CGMCC 4.7035]WNC00017.1 ATP-binding protein [Streptomyces sp. CGMCC 4.7035]
MSTPRAAWRNTTHDWASTVDLDHLEHIRQNPAAFAPRGILHLIFEVVAYAADEAECGNGGHCRITLYPDGSVAIADNGRGTDTRLDEHGRIVKKPVMATKDLRFFDHPDAPSLPDTHPRRGMSVVAALSTWLVHTNRRRNGSWTQRYEHGVPTTELQPIADDHTTGTTVHFMADRSLMASSSTADDLARLTEPWPHLSVEIDDRRAT